MAAGALLPLLAAVGLLLAAPAWALEGALEGAVEDAPDRLKEVERSIEADQARQRFLERQSDAIRAEIDELRARLVELAEQERAQESELDELESALADLEDEERRRAARLEEERERIAALLGALQRLSRIPPEAVLGRSASPIDTLRSAVLLRETAPVLRARAEALADAVETLAAVRQQMAARRTETLAARLALAERQRETADLVARREALSRDTEEERQAVSRRMATLGAQAGDLRQLVERIERQQRAAAGSAARREAERLESERWIAEQSRRMAERRQAALAAAPKPEPPPAQTAPPAQAGPAPMENAAVTAVLGRGGLRMPAGGRMTLAFGQKDRFGEPAKGVTIAARPGAAVVAPYSGSIMFAGPFRGYGQILIVEHSNGYHSLIAGLGRIDIAVGRHVAQGEPIGSMPSATDGSADLYFEFRRNGQPIDPRRGFGAPVGKGQG